MKTPPKLPDPDFVPTDWPELFAHYLQCLDSLDYSAADMRQNADCPVYGPVVGPRSPSGSACVRAGIVLLNVMERDLREKRRQGPPEMQRDVDVLLPRTCKALRAFFALPV